MKFCCINKQLQSLRIADFCSGPFFRFLRNFVDNKLLLLSRKYGGDIKFTRKHFRQLHTTRFLSSSSNKLFAFFSESDFHFISMIYDVVLLLEFGHFSLNSALIPTLSDGDMIQKLTLSSMNKVINVKFMKKLALSFDRLSVNI